MYMFQTKAVNSQRTSMAPHLEDEASNEASQAKNDSGVCGDGPGGTSPLVGLARGGSAGTSGGGSAVAGGRGSTRRSGGAGNASRGHTRTGGRARIGRSERNGNTETRFFGGLHVGSKLLEGPITSGGRVYGTVHAALAVWWAATEEPNGGFGLGDLQRVHTNLACTGVVGNEARVEPILLGGSIELPCAWVEEAALSDGMVTTGEHEVDDISSLGSNLLRFKFETGCTILASTDKDGDVGGRDEGRGEGGDGGDDRGSGKLHGAKR
jgi:hypothetical protein